MTRSDVVVVEGLSPGPAKLYTSELNQALAQRLDADVLLVGRWPAAERGPRAGRAPDNSAEGRGQREGLAERSPSPPAGTGPVSDARVIGCVVHGLPATDPPAAAQLGEALARRGLCAPWPRCRTVPS